MGILSQVAKRIKAYHGSPNLNSQMAGRHPGDSADLSALQLAPAMAKGLINDVSRYGTQAVTGQVSDKELLPQQPLTGQAKTIADAVGSSMGAALNYKVPSLMRGPRSVMDDISVVADGYRKVKPSLVNAFGESNVNRGEGAGLLGSMLIPAKIPKAQSGGLFSQASIASDNLQRKTGNADGFFNDLTGKGQVKPDELNAMGFKENFAGRNDVSRQEVQQFVNDNQVQIKETVLGEDAKFGSYTLDGGDNYRELLLQDNSSAGLLDELNLLNKQIEDAKVALRNDTPALLNVAEDMQRESDKFIGADYFSENFFTTITANRELSDFQDGKLLSDEAAGKYINGAKELIERRDELVKQKDNLPEPFINSSHFDEPNILAHLRMKDRVDTDGNKTLLLEEVQSDLHQKGADVGYQNPKRMKELDDEYDRLDDEILKSYQQHNSMDAGRDRAYIRNTIHELELERTNIDIERGEAAMAVPDAPFKTDEKSSWYNLALKRGLLEAVEGGYDKLALTTGRQQADRYDLSKQINEVRLGGNEQSGFTVSAFDKNNTPVIMQSIDSLDALPNLIGKDAAKSLVDQPLTDTASGSARILAGQDLSVGGEGMKQFYDRTLPNALGKLVKQDGQKVGTSFLPRELQSMDGEFNYEGYTVDEVSDIRNLLAGRNDPMVNHTPEQTQRLKNLLAKEIPEGDSVHSIDITPKMRERVKKGLPMFATGGAAIGLGELMRQQQQEKEAGSGLLHSL